MISRVKNACPKMLHCEMTVYKPGDLLIFKPGGRSLFIFIRRCAGFPGQGWSGTAGGKHQNVHGKPWKNRPGKKAAGHSYIMNRKGGGTQQLTRPFHPQFGDIGGKGFAGAGGEQLR